MAKRQLKELKHHLTTKQVQLFFNTFKSTSRTSRRNKLVFKVMLEMGLRHSEAIAMRYSHLHKDDNNDPYYHLPAVHSKNKKAAYIPMSRPLYKELLELKEIYSDDPMFVFRPISKDVPLQDRYVRKLANDHGVLADLPFPVSSHSFRRTFCMRTLKSTGGDLYLTSQMMRHSSVTTTQIYLSAITEDKKIAMQKVLADNKIDY